MQDKESEVINNQRKRRKRISRIKNGIMITVAGWILLSMILIIILFVQVTKLRHELRETQTSDVFVQSSQEPDSETEQEEETEETAKSYTAVTPPASGIDDTENIAQAGDTHKVYLTFEDGPSDNTDAILDILNQYGVKATFFVVGQEDEDKKELYKRIVDEGHTLGMHSYSNKYSVLYESDEAFEEDFNKLRTELYDITGVESMYYRFPGGSSNQISNAPMEDFIHYLNEQGVIYYDWNVSAGDAASNAYSSEEIVANVLEDVVKYKTSVVLLHDTSDKSATVEALPALIESLKNMSAEILPIDEDTQVIQYVKADSID